MNVDEDVVNCNQYAFLVSIIMESVEHMIGELTLVELFSQMPLKRSSDFDGV